MHVRLTLVVALGLAAVFAFGCQSDKPVMGLHQAADGTTPLTAAAGHPQVAALLKENGAQEDVTVMMQFAKRCPDHMARFTQVLQQLTPRPQPAERTPDAVSLKGIEGEFPVLRLR